MASMGQDIGKALEAGAEKIAAGKMVRAVKSLKIVDPEKLKLLGITEDKAAYIRDLAFAREQNPELSAMRDAAIAKGVEIFGADQYPWQDAEAGMISIAGEDTSARKALEDQFLAKAKEQLDLGSKLDSNFQAELVRSGLEKGGAAGFGANKTGPLAQLLGNKIGEAGVALEQTRIANAQGLANAADVMKSNRVNILAGILPNLMNTTNFNLGLVGKGMDLFNSERPNIGPGGEAMVGFEEQKRNEENNKILMNAQAQGNRVRAERAWQSAMVQGGMNTVQAVLGGVMGGMGGMGGMMGGAGGAAGGAGGGGGMLSGLMGGGGGGGAMPAGVQAGAEGFWGNPGGGSQPGIFAPTAQTTPSFNWGNALQGFMKSYR